MSTRQCERGKSSQSRRSFRRSQGAEVGVVNDGHEHFAGAMDAEGLLHQEAFAVMVATFKLDLKGFTQNTEGIVVSVQRAVDDRRDHAFGVVLGAAPVSKRFCRCPVHPAPDTSRLAGRGRGGCRRFPAGGPAA